MARMLRLQYEGAIYHICVRGNNRRKIFLTDGDRNRFLKRLSESAEFYGVRVYLYCLMGNHFHLLAETPRGNISRFMQSLLTGYTVYFNLKHGRCGHVVQGRYVAQLVDGDQYLLRLSRYIHLNPVRPDKTEDRTLAQKRQRLRGYGWSSYRGYIDTEHAREFVDHSPILKMMDCPAMERRERYAMYVEAGLASNDKELEGLLAENPRAIGRTGFREQVDDQYRQLRDDMDSQEDVSFRRESHFCDPDAVVLEAAKAFKVTEADMTRQMRGTWARPVAAHLLCKLVGMSQREAGERLGYGTGAAVSRQLKRLRQALAEDIALAQRVRKIESRILAG